MSAQHEMKARESAELFKLAEGENCRSLEL
jgi:hypothetical protein